MSFRLIKFVLLACVVYWATGAAHYVHEITEHAGGELRNAGVAKWQGNSPTLRPSQPQADNDHDECMTCQMLTHMSAHHNGLAAFLVSFLIPIATLPVLHQQRSSLPARPALPIRGPPVMV